MVTQSVPHSWDEIIKFYAIQSNSKDFSTEEQFEVAVSGRAYSCFGRQFNSEQVQAIHRAIASVLAISAFIGLSISYKVAT